MGKNILVTGISRGVGFQIAKTCLGQGNTVFGLNRSISPQLEDLIQKYPDRLNFFKFDLSNSKKIKSAIFKNFIGLNTRIDAYINNAAIAYDDIVTNADVENLQQMYNVNVISPIMITKNVIRNMLLHQVSGSIVHMSSISVHTGYKGLSMYASTKGALEAFSKNVAREWGRKKIRSNCLVAGFMETDMSSELSDDQKDRIYKRTSLKEPTKIESVVETICFLLSEESNSITGQNIHVDAGTI
ncbi:MAG: SDR family oxidoreductase [Balneolaceae bacterium]|nr:SDR family oxidoreductase [Balneolaceae bacterium]